MGASSEDDAPTTPLSSAGVNLDQGPVVGEKPGNENYEYGGGNIAVGESTVFGYKTTDKID